MLFPEKLPTIANVAAGAKVSINMPVGNTYETLYLLHSGVTLAQLKNIKLEINGNLVSEWTDGNEIVSLDAHYGRYQEAGILAIHFKRPELEVLEKQRFFGLDTHPAYGMNTVTISIDIDSGATAPKLEAIADKTQSIGPINGKVAPNWLTKLRRFVVPVSATGQFDIDRIPRPQGASIAAIHLYMPDDGDAGDDCQILKADIKIDNTSWHDIDASFAAKLQKANKRNPQTTQSAVIDFIRDGDMTNALYLRPDIQDMRLRCEAASAGQVVVLVEYVDTYSPTGF
jgi:hypothetical protein